MTWLTKRGRRGWAFVEILAVMGTISVLLMMGVMVHRSLRTAARVTAAESNLQQISTGMELYFRKYHTYPPPGCDLVTELAPFVDNPNVFENPMLEEPTPGTTLNALYVRPTLEELDSPDNYITAMVSDNGSTVLLLKTGRKVERRDNLNFIPGDLNDSLAAILHPPNGLPPVEKGSASTTGVRGLINLNPRNNSDFEFDLSIDGGREEITRDDLLASCGQLDRTWENEPAWIRFCPKGNGNQNSLMLNGTSYPLKNGTLYLLYSFSATLRLYNASGNGNGESGTGKVGSGRAMGRWWMDITADYAFLVDCRTSTVITGGLPGQ